MMPFMASFLWMGKEEPRFLMVPVTQEHHLRDLHEIEAGVPEGEASRPGGL